MNQKPRKPLLRGRRAEQKAKRLLKNKGWRILATNYSCLFGEIDLIGVDKDWLVLVEVKARSSLEWGRAEEAVIRAKCRKIAKTGDHFRQHYSGILPPSTRIDVIGFTTIDGKQELVHEKNVYREGLG